MAPLFDRLTDQDLTSSEEVPIFSSYTEDQVVASIQRECAMILNTRCKLTQEDYEELEPEAEKFRFPSFYGIPDGLNKNPKNTTDAHDMERTMANAIEIFESRLQNVRVSVQSYDEPSQTLGLLVEGDLVIGKIAKPLSFPMALEDFQEQGDREIEAYDTRAKIDLKKEQ